MNIFNGDKEVLKAKGQRGDKYVVLQVVLTEKLLGTGSGISSLTNLQNAINEQASKGYRLHTISTAASGSKGFWLGGDKIQATMVFERIDDEYDKYIASEESKVEEAIIQAETNSSEINVKKIKSDHFNKILSYTMDRSLEKKIKDLYIKVDDYFVYNDSGEYGSETKDFVNKYIKLELTKLIKFEEKK